PGPRALALGNAFVAVRDPLAAEYNPAALAGPAVAASYQALPVEAVAGAAQVVVPLGDHALGASLRFLDYGEVAVLESGGDLPVGQPTGAVAGGGELSALLAGRVRLGPLQLGVAGRWLRQDVAGLTDDVVAADVGALLGVTGWLDVGASVQHLGPELAAGRSAPLPRTVRVGAAVRTHLSGVDVLVAAEAREREERRGAGVGLEIARRWDGVEAGLRLGLETRPEPGDAFAPLVVGGGVRLGRLGVELAWRALGPLGSTRQLGLRYRF
ncbi:MAG: hypothetical protein ACLFRX_03645, partial [Gemmatimonadota bacterium]